ncbi:Ig-like domain-containing protein [Larkinella soli]|uniref:Ig-like domain-containing protein n=1 Tax=Larkinella soli TaxID=1770527 RepID=UPI000FFC75F1|nr:T9SS type A sorting domain-containing protein [Larkinella soli]
MNLPLRLYWILLVVLSGSVGITSAQTITTGAVSPSSVCAGGTISVPFTVSGGIIGNGFAYKVQIATSAAGPFSDLPTTGNSSPLTAAISADQTSGSTYRIRVSAVSSSTSINGSLSATVLTIKPIPGAPTVTVPAAYCQGATASALSATPGAGGTLNWYGTSATGGSASPTAPVPATNQTQTYYVSQTVNGCEGPRAAIQVTVTPLPAAPGVSAVAYCQGATPAALTATAGSGGTLNWYGTNATGGTASAVAPTPSAAAAGTTNYYVSQTINGCESPRAAIAVTINKIPAAPTVVSPVSYCQDATASALSATPDGGTLNWYGTNATGGTASGTAPVPPTNATGTATYYVSQTVAGCEGPRTSITVTVNAKPAPPTVVTPVSVCQGTPPAALSATAGTGNTLKWYGNNQTGGTASATAPTPLTNTAGNFNYYVSQAGANGCESDRAQIVFTVKPTPAAPGVAAVSICQNTTPAALTASLAENATANWYTAATGGTPSATAPTPPTSATGATTYYVSQTINGCEGPRAALTVTVKPLPGAPTVGAALTYCQAATAAPLSATAATGGTLNWYGTSATGGTASGTAPTPATTEAGNFEYFVSQTINGCEGPRAGIAVTINAKPALPTVADLRYCQGATPAALTAAAATGATLNWYGTSATGGTASANAPTPATTNPGETTFYVSQKAANGCESDRGAIKVRVFATPTLPTVPALPEVCQNTPPVSFSATGQGLKWYNAETGGTATAEAPVQNTGTAGTFTFYVSQTIEQCEGPRAPAKLVVKPLPQAPGVENKVVCQDTPEQTLSAAGSNIRWFDANDNGIGAPRPATNIESTQTYTFKATQTVNGCESQKASLTFTVNVTPKPAVVTPVVYCQNATAKPLEATGEGLKWIDPYGREFTSAPTPPTTNVSVNPEGDSYFVTQKLASTGCESRKSEIRLIVNAPPTAKIEGTTTVNLGLTAPMTITFTSVPPFSYTLSDGTTGTSETQQKTVNVLPKKNTIYTITTISNSCGTGTPIGAFTVNVKAPTVTTSALASTTVCAGSQVQVPFTTTGEFTSGNAFTVEIAAASDSLFARKLVISGTASQSPITAKLPDTLVTGLYRVRVSASNPAVPVPGSNSPTVLNVRSLPTVTLTGSKDIYDNESTPLTFSFTGDAPWTFEYADSVKTTRVTTSTNPHTIPVTPPKSTTYRVTSVSNNCGNGRTSGTATIRVLPVLGLEPDPLVTGVKVYPVPVDQILTIDIDVPLQKDPARIQLTDAGGRVTKQLTTRQRQTTLDLSRQTAGIYLLHIQVGKRTTVRKIMKR